MIKASIVVPTYNRSDFLGKCLHALKEQDFPKDEFELFLVDDGSTDSTESLVKQFITDSPGYHFHYLHQKNQGPAAARNLGWQTAKGEIIAFIDDDCLASKQWLKEITSGYDRNDVAGICGNVQAVELDNQITQFLTFDKLHQVPFCDNYGQIVYPITCNASFRRSVLELVGGFDSTFPYPGGEDVDLGIRIRRRGFFFLDNRNAIIQHYHKDSLSGMLKTWYRYGIGAAQWQMKNKCSLYHNRDERGNVLWTFDYPARLRPIKGLCWHLLRAANLFRDIGRYRERGVSTPVGVLYFTLDYIRNTTYHIGEWVGYKRYRNLFQ